ncbi:unnamed protein product, partial [Amoebophrya sp. A120]
TVCALEKEARVAWLAALRTACQLTCRTHFVGTAAIQPLNDFPHKNRISKSRSRPAETKASADVAGKKCDSSILPFCSDTHGSSGSVSVLFDHLPKCLWSKPAFLSRAAHASSSTRRRDESAHNQNGAPKHAAPVFHPQHDGHVRAGSRCGGAGNDTAGRRWASILVASERQREVLQEAQSKSVLSPSAEKVVVKENHSSLIREEQTAQQKNNSRIQIHNE